jgi:hypothetical protein
MEGNTVIFVMGVGRHRNDTLQAVSLVSCGDGWVASGCRPAGADRWDDGHVQLRADRHRAGEKRLFIIVIVSSKNSGKRRGLSRGQVEGRSEPACERFDDVR